jgi:hypothetical protein
MEILHEGHTEKRSGTVLEMLDFSPCVETQHTSVKCYPPPPPIDSARYVVQESTLRFLGQHKLADCDR